MASGDAAAAQGFTPVLATDDFRLGYVRINDAADFAATRVRYYTATSASAMNALTGMKRGDLCWRSDESIEYKYDVAWRRYRSDYITFSPGMDQLAYSSVTAKYRFIAGKVRMVFQGTVNGSPGGGAVRLGIPVTPDTTVPLQGNAVFLDSGAANLLPITFLGWNNGAIGYYRPTSVNPSRQTAMVGNDVASGWSHQLVCEYDPA